MITVVLFHQLTEYKENIYVLLQVQHNGLIQEIHHPTAGKVRVVGPAVRYSEAKTVDPTAPPLLGQNTQEVLKGLLGYSDETISLLRSQKVID